MTDLAKAIAFLTRCLKWSDVATADGVHGMHIFGEHDGRALHFNPHSAADLEKLLQEFLGTRYLIQINRGTSSRFHWRVIVGLQDKSARGACLENAQAESEDLWDCIFDACIAAAQALG